MTEFMDNGYSLGQFIRKTANITDGRNRFGRSIRKMTGFTDSRVIRQDAIHKNERIYGWGFPYK